MSRELTPDYMCKRCIEVGLIRYGNTTSPTAGWWGVVDHEGKSYELVEWHRSDEREVWVIDPFHSVVKCTTVEEFETALAGCLNRFKLFLQVKYNSSIDEILKKLD